MTAMPELGYIVVLLGIFVGAFLLANIGARAAGYRE